MPEFPAGGGLVGGVGLAAVAVVCEGSCAFRKRRERMTAFSVLSPLGRPVKVPVS